LLCVMLLIACLSNKQQNFEDIARAGIENKIDTIISILNKTESTVATDDLKALFINSRKHYKKIEPLVEYYYQGLSRRINGPALPEIKTDDNVVNDASGFQVIEELIYSDTVDAAELKKQIKILTTDLLFVKKNSKELPVQEHHFYELVQHQLIRIAALGITGFDSPVAFLSVNEAEFSLQGIIELYELYCKSKSNKTSNKLTAQLQQAITYTQQHPDFNSFNRLEFIKDYLMPISIDWENEFKTVINNNPEFKKNKVFYGHLADLMQGKNLNPDAFSPYAASVSTPQKIALGKLLFSDVSLSKNKNMSCASCHNPDKAFTDGKVVSVTNIHSNTVNRNSPTVLYAAFQKAFFYDLRSQDLENQIESVMKNPDEFNLSPQEVQQRINSNPTLASEFAKAFPDKKEISPYEIRNTIAAYVRSLMPFSSRIDKYFKGQTTLTENEINGFNLFTGKAKCATCHFIPLYSGTIPPWYNNTESEVIGVPKNAVWKNAVVDEDLGRYNLNQLEPLKFSFKTPTVRNIEKTAPYMHNGVYNTLDEVVKFYELGGGNGIGMNLQYQTLPFDNLQLTEKEKLDIISFLKTLTDKDENN
jgi:cytochrome c peroxidase